MIHCVITKVFEEVNVQQVGHDFRKIQDIPDMDEHLTGQELMVTHSQSAKASPADFKEDQGQGTSRGPDYWENEMGPSWAVLLQCKEHQTWAHGQAFLI